MTSVRVTFGELRLRVIDVTRVIAESTGVEMRAINLRTAINHDLGIDGDDWDEVFESLQALHTLSFITTFMMKAS